MASDSRHGQTSGDPNCSVSAHHLATLEKQNPYWMQLRTPYADELADRVARLPPPTPWE